MIFKNTIRKIKKSFGRYLSLIVIVFIGIAIFSSLQLCSPKIRDVQQHYYEDTNLMDYKINGTLGLTDDDVESLKQLEHVDQVIGSYSKEVFDGTDVVKVHAIEDEMNGFELIDGRMPTKDEECLADANHYQVGDTIEITEPNEEDDLEVKTFTVVGTIYSPLYTGTNYGSSQIGNGKLYSYLFVPKDVFRYEAYTEIYLTMEKDQEDIVYSNSYQEKSNKMLDEIEKDERIMCCSYHIGYVRHDSDKCGASVIVVPNSEKDTAYANTKADEIAAFAFSKRHEFHFTGTALEPEDAVREVMAAKGKPCFITDSGDNCTAGGPGCNTFILRQFLALEDYAEKRILFACISDEGCANQLADYALGSTVSFDLGIDEDALSAKVSLIATILAKGELHHHYGDQTAIGSCVTVRLKDRPIDIVIAQKAVSFAEKAQYDYAGINMDYDVIVVKQGYLYPELKQAAKYFVMSLTDGATNQRTEKIKYQKILRPMYPIDAI